MEREREMTRNRVAAVGAITVLTAPTSRCKREKGNAGDLLLVDVGQ